MEINNPAAKAAVTEAFWQYVEALVDNDIDCVKASFWNSEHTLRYGTGENLYGMAAIEKFRNGQRGHRITLEVTHLVVTTFGQDFATANCEMLRENGTTGRMTHSWVRLEAGWRIVAAHVSANPSPTPIASAPGR